jgi:hypothetical protein
VAEKTPYIAPEIVEWLQKLFPLASPNEADTDRQIWIAVGVQKVVKKIKLVSDEQQKNVLAA